MTVTARPRGKWFKYALVDDPPPGPDRQATVRWWDEDPDLVTADQPADTDETASVLDSDAGMSTVEYAVGTIVAAAFAAVLYKIVTGNSVITGLTNLVNSALNTL